MNKQKNKTSKSLLWWSLVGEADITQVSTALPLHDSIFQAGVVTQLPVLAWHTGSPAWVPSLVLYT